MHCVLNFLLGYRGCIVFVFLQSNNIPIKGACTFSDFVIIYVVQYNIPEYSKSEFQFVIDQVQTWRIQKLINDIAEKINGPN